MLSNGGIATPATAARFPVRLLESGPAGGALAAAAFGSAGDVGDLISFDMGGTTAKLCVIERGEPLIAQEFEVDRVYRLKRGSGLPVRIAVVDMIEIGAGGGSIARVDSLGLVTVGPDSSGSDPGPACYGLGGVEPTVTDADLVLGYLDSGSFLGGRMQLDVAAARSAIERRIADPLGVSVEDAAFGIHDLVNEGMTNAARVHAVERGKDPSSLPLFAFGGAGPVHACGVARALGVPWLVAPPGGRRAVGDRLPHGAAGVRLRPLGARAYRGPGLGGRRRALRGDGGRGPDPARRIGRARRAMSRTGGSPTCATRDRATRSGCP